jgi:hypothetical protein
MKKQLGWQWEFGRINQTEGNGLKQENQVISTPMQKGAERMMLPSSEKPNTVFKKWSAAKPHRPV